VDFERVLKSLLADFDYQQIRYAAIGGFALADIERVMAVYGQRLDWQRIDEFYELFDLSDDARRLKQ